MLPHASIPLLRSRSRTLWRELSCSEEGPPPLGGKSVENGKSGSTFLVPGGDGISADDGASYSALIKQVNKQEAALLPTLLPKLIEQYGRDGGSLLTPVLGWLRYSPPDGGDVFEGALLENVARRPPAASAHWKPFDMKGIRLYAHEKRWADEFGERGLHVGEAIFERMRRALDADVHFLTQRRLVDFSYLVTVFPIGDGAPRPCTELRTEVNVAGRLGGHRGAAASSALVPAFYRLPVRSAATQANAASTDAPSAVSDAVAQSESGLCVPVVFRLAIIDYLRAWQLTERVEHISKTISRDLVAGERNHAVVPVDKFGERFVAFYAERLLRPAHPLTWAAVMEAAWRPAHPLSWAATIEAAWHTWRGAATLAVEHLHLHLQRMPLPRADARPRDSESGTVGQEGSRAGTARPEPDAHNAVTEAEQATMPSNADGDVP